MPDLDTRSSDLRIIPREFIRYKFLNSLFLGLSVGAIFVVYRPLNPSIYSVGGIALAVGMLIVAKFYEKIMNIGYFFKISLLVEIVMLLIIAYFILNPYNYMSALIVYIGYQLTFVFGSYLIRAETMILKKDKLLTMVDSAKQIGYLTGMAGSYIFYKVLSYLGVSDKKDQVYDLHFLLFVCEVAVIWFLLRSFKKDLSY
jgi:predicted MFS family arabinose efflux permease